MVFVICIAAGETLLPPAWEKKGLQTKSVLFLGLSFGRKTDTMNRNTV